MKRRVRTHPTNPFYTNEPAVSEKDIASQSLVQNASLGNQNPKMVPKKPGKSTGLAGGADKHKPKAGHALNIPPSAAAKPSKSPKQHIASPHLRMSGHPGAHMIGGIKKIKSL